MSAQDIFHRRVLHPMESLGRVRLFVPLRRNKPIALQSSRRHEDEDAKRSIAEAKALRERLAMAADQRVDLLNVVVIDVFQFLRQREVAAGELLEGLGGGHVEKTPELVVAGNAALSVPQDIDCTQVLGKPIWSFEILEKIRVVVVGDGAWVVDAKGIKGIGKRNAIVERFLGACENGVFNGDGVLMLPIGNVEEGNLIWKACQHGACPNSVGRGFLPGSNECILYTDVNSSVREYGTPS